MNWAVVEEHVQRVLIGGAGGHCLLPARVPDSSPPSLKPSLKGSPRVLIHCLRGVDLLAWLLYANRAGVRP